jgi:hypothetical protein
MSLLISELNVTVKWNFFFTLLLISLQLCRIGILDFKFNFLTSFYVDKMQNSRINIHKMNNLNNASLLRAKKNDALVQELYGLSEEKIRLRKNNIKRVVPKEDDARQRMRLLL